jgi:hypothetical protein
MVHCPVAHCPMVSLFLCPIVHCTAAQLSRPLRRRFEKPDCFVCGDSAASRTWR